MKRLNEFYQKSATQKLLASLLSILVGLCVGGLIIVIVGIFSDNIDGKGIIEGLRLLFGGIFSTGRSGTELTFGFNSKSIGNMLFRAAPLIMCGLSVAVSQKTGLFNIGAPGQYLMGAMSSLLVALSVPSAKYGAVTVWLLAFLAAIVASAIWGAIPGILKAFLNMNEVLACIMTNWIAANVVTWVFDKASFSMMNESYMPGLTGSFQNYVENTKTSYIYKTTFNNVETAKFGLNKLFPDSQVNGGILIAILFAIGIYVLINKTTLGFELKACGANRFSAKYAGIHDKRNTVLSMMIAGSLAGVGGALYYLSGNTEFVWETYQTLPATGFNGIAVSLLAVNNPIGVIFTGLFMSMLDIVGLQLTNLTAYNEYITDVITASIVYLSAFSMVFQILLRGKKKNEKKAESAPAVKEEPVPEKPAVTEEEIAAESEAAVNEAKGDAGK